MYFSGTTHCDPGFAPAIPQIRLGKRGRGGTVNPPRNRKSGIGNHPPTVGAPELYPNQFKIGKVGASKATMPETWQAALAA